jgi:SAM-dependent methyltransferase
MSIWLLILLAFVLSFAYAGLRAAPWVPLHKQDLQRVLRLMNLKGGEVVYDLGCGDGRIIAAAARHGARCTGFEISLLPFLLARLRTSHLRGPTCRSLGQGGEVIGLYRPKVLLRDFWFCHLGDADIVYFFFNAKNFS